eukprot:TRINITY_DN2095_c0_g1_i2.p1 TRINITY_DN2095_c0_g1~~TRINITY_DN2095_c0_g1_i2.p1  ORF type:complete len:747 (-),score=223.75 TRINITY_DN2095_c0_g1_i2:258-2498(-)
MLRSLVGSEMCIRDSINAEYRGMIRHVAGSVRFKSAAPSWILRLFSKAKMEAAKITTREQVHAKLKELGIEFKEYEHGPCVKLEDYATHQVKYDHAPFIKTYVYGDKKDNLYQIIAKYETKLGKSFWKSLGTSGGNVRFAKEDVLSSVLNVQPGEVNPFSLANDSGNKVKHFVYDASLGKVEYWAFHPFNKNFSIELKREDFINKFLTSINRTAQEIDLEAEETAEQPKAKAAPKQAEEAKADEEGHTKLGLDYKKSENFSMWYTQVILKSEMIEYYDVSGCYILRPWAFAIWEHIQNNFDSWIKKLGVENAYFPVFVSERALNKEKEHVEGFAPEVAWVTKYGTSTLKEPVAIRPTSETIMYPAYSKWITSHRDLPLKLNQWTNVVRWEFKHPTPFIRTREFLWQEGHTAHATKEEADAQVFEILDLYRRVYEDLLAVPVIKGIKSETEKFAGGFYTTTVETFSPGNGRGIQAATSHQLGQNFSKMFEISFENEKKEREFAWQTSWGMTTRSIGVMVLLHADDKGLVLPPRVAKIQVVVVPVFFKDTNVEELTNSARLLVEQLKENGVRAHLDDRDNYSPGWKYNHWELKGVPVRFELGPKDLQNNQVRAVIRRDGSKFQIDRANIIAETKNLLEKIHKDMFLSVKEQLDNRRKQAADWPTFMKELNQNNVVLTPWCESAECEGKVKERSGIESKLIEASEAEIQLTGSAKTLCIPLEQDPIKEGEVCFHCGAPAKKRVLWGRSY